MRRAKSGKRPQNSPRFHQARASPDKTAIKRQTQATDKQIDALVSELYGLTKDEIPVAEGAHT